MKTILGALAALAAVTAAVPAAAADFSFTGAFTADDDVAFFDFTATGASTITLRSFSYAGGTNALGQVIAAGGFDPILTLFDRDTGLKIAQQDDAEFGVPQDPTTGNTYDVLFSRALAAGNYRVALSQYNNFGGDTLSDPFQRAGQGNFTAQYCSGGSAAPFCQSGGAQRNGNWAFDILDVDNATGPDPVGAVPEPATWAMMIAGFGLVGGAARRRRMRPALA